MTVQSTSCKQYFRHIDPSGEYSPLGVNVSEIFIYAVDDGQTGTWTNKFLLTIIQNTAAPIQLNEFENNVCKIVTTLFRIQRVNGSR